MFVTRIEALIREQEAKIAAAKAKGGGGGGSGLVGETGAEMVAIDYYRAMMQVLGDISGVAEPTKVRG